MLEGCVLGNILVGDSLDAYFYDVHQPIKFVAADSLESDSGMVLLRVGLVEDEEKNNLTESIGNYCFIGNFQSSNYVDASASIKNPLEIIYPDSNTTEWITIDPQMPNVVCKAKLHNYNKGLVNYEWEYWVSYTLFRHKFTSVDILCRRTGKVKFIGNSNANNSDTTSWTVSFSASNVDSAIFVGKHYSQEGGCFAEIPQWNEGENVFIGGDVFVQVTAKNSNGQIIGFKQQNSGVILGNNPSPQAIQNYAGTNELKAIIYHESLINSTYGRWKQFNPQDIDLYYPNIKKWLYGQIYNKKGYPNYGVPNGYGLAKIDNRPSPTEMDLWNWKNNVNTSRTRLDSAKIHSTNYIINTGATYEEEKFWMNAFQDYNSGKKYWIWDEDEGWKKNPSRPNERTR